MAFEILLSSKTESEPLRRITWKSSASDLTGTEDGVCNEASRSVSEKAAMERLLGLRVVRRNRATTPPRASRAHAASATSPPLGGSSECFHGRSSDSTGSDLLAGLPRSSTQCHLGVRTCLPLRGSSGLPPDSLFIFEHLREEPWNTLTIAETNPHAPTYCG